MALDEIVNVRLGGRDVARLSALARRLPGLRRGALVRELLLRALGEVEADPAVLVAPPERPDLEGES